MNIKGAFDNIWWPILTKNLKQPPFPTYLINWIISLENKYVSQKENGIKITKQTFGGFPQGSCLGPLLWLLIADVILKNNGVILSEYKHSPTI